MATVAELYEWLNEKAPFDTQLPFDNAGFLVGRGNTVVTRVLVTLDITQAVVREAASIGAQLILSHHPVIFTPLKAVTDGDETGRVVLELVAGGVAAICAHTNLDAARGGVNDTLATRLGVTETVPFTDDGIGRQGLLAGGPTTLASFAAHIKTALGAPGVRVADAGRAVHRVALVGGAGGDDLLAAVQAGCDTFVTADVKHHTFLSAHALGVNLIDAGHYATEQVVCATLEAWLRADFPRLDVVQSAASRPVPDWL